MVMNVKTFDSYDLADMARAYPNEAECVEAHKEIWIRGEYYAFIRCFGRLKAIDGMLRVVNRYVVTFEADDTHQEWQFTDRAVAEEFAEDCYKEENGLL